VDKSVPLLDDSVVSVTGLLVVHVFKALEVLCEFRLGTVSNSQTFLHNFQLLFLTIDSSSFWVNHLEMVAQLFLFSVFIAFLDFVVKFGFDLADAPIFDLRLEQKRLKLVKFLVPLAHLVGV